jgi:predicted nucleic acid-binding protein
MGVLTLLTDDLAVREAAKTLNLVAVGSLGLVMRVYKLGRISLADAEQHILALYEVSSLFVTRAIVEMAIEGLREQARQE